MNIYVDLTKQMNSGRVRAILSSGQAVVLHHLALASKDVLTAVDQGRDALEAALDAERRGLMRANEARLDRYERACVPWSAHWPTLQREISRLPLRRAHAIVVDRAAELLPLSPPSVDL